MPFHAALTRGSQLRGGGGYRQPTPNFSSRIFGLRPGRKLLRQWRLGLSGSPRTWCGRSCIPAYLVFGDFVFLSSFPWCPWRRRSAPPPCELSFAASGLGFYRNYWRGFFFASLPSPLHRGSRGILLKMSFSGFPLMSRKLLRRAWEKCVCFLPAEKKTPLFSRKPFVTASYRGAGAGQKSKKREPSGWRAFKACHLLLPLMAVGRPTGAGAAG